MAGDNFSNIVVVWSRIPEIIQQLDKAAADVVRKAAFDVEARAKASAPVDTGFLKSSIYTVTNQGSDYAPADGGPALPPVDPPSDPHTAFVAVGAEYGIYVEYGTADMAAQPYLIPAADAVRPAFVAAMAAIGDKLK